MGGGVNSASFLKCGLWQMVFDLAEALQFTQQISAGRTNPVASRGELAVPSYVIKGTVGCTSSKVLLPEARDHPNSSILVSPRSRAPFCTLVKTQASFL